MNLVRVTPSCGIPPFAPVWAQAGEIFEISAVPMGNKQRVTAGVLRVLSFGGLRLLCSADSRFDMQRIRSTVLLLGLAGFGVGAVAQQTPSTNTPSGEADLSARSSKRTAGALPSARGFDGRIVKLGNQFILKNAIAHISYRLDDQKKAGHYEGKRVKVTATMDSVSNTLHVIDISDSSRKH